MKKYKNINPFTVYDPLECEDEMEQEMHWEDFQNDLEEEFDDLCGKHVFIKGENIGWQNLNHQWAISDIKDLKNSDDEPDNIFTCKLKHISEDDDMSSTQKVFIKMAPLLDPFKYLVGKYNHADSNLFNLPSFDKNVKVHPKIYEPNNSSFTGCNFLILNDSKVFTYFMLITYFLVYINFLICKTIFEKSI